MLRVLTIAGALILFAVCGGACHKPKTSAERFTNRGPLRRCKLPGIDESHLPNSKHVVIAQGAHGVDGMTNVECIDKVMLEFLAKGNARDLDTSCVERVAAPRFVTSESK